MSSEVVVEIATWPASEAYKSNPSVIDPALKILAATKGSQKIYHGLQYEDKSTAYLVIIWDKLADHQALIDDKEEYSKLKEALTPSLGGQLTLFHVAFKGNPVPVSHLSSPIAEFATHTLKEGKTNADLEGLVWNPAIIGDGSFFVEGKVVEKDNEYVLLKGWDSYEAHQDARKGGDETVKKFVTALHEIAEDTLYHVKLTEFKA